MSKASILDPDLLARIEAFAFDDPADTLNFTARLARENAWSRAFAGRVLREYRRFLYLACTAGHEVTPSQEVDQAWHLHMIYTRSYWDDLCGQTLRRPLHHGPTRGGTGEAARYDGNYTRTLAAYVAAFGTPPADIWPAANIRFAPVRTRTIDTSQNWIVPKRPFHALLRYLRLHGLAAGAVLAATGAAFAATGAVAVFSFAVIAAGAGIALVAVWKLIAAAVTKNNASDPSKKKDGGSGCGSSGCGSSSSSQSSHSHGDSGGDGGSGCGGGGCGGGD